MTFLFLFRAAATFRIFRSFVFVRFTGRGSVGEGHFFRVGVDGEGGWGNIFF